MENNLEELLMDIRTSPTQIEKAEAELRFIQSISDGNFHEKLSKLSVLSGEKLSYIRHRLRLLKATEFSKSLWPLIESGELTINAAVIKLRELEARAGVPKRKAKIEEVIESHPISIVPDPSVCQIGELKKEKQKNKKIDKLSFLPGIDIIMKKMEIFLHKKCPNLSEDTINFLIQDMSRNIKASITLTKARAVSEEKISDARVEILSRKAIITVNESCDLLGIDRPKKRHPIDLDRAKKNMWAKTRTYHPDLHPDDVEAPARFREVVEAYKNLQDYNENLERINV